MTIDELEQLIANLTWADFQKTDLGEFTVGYVPPNQHEPHFIKFYMRIGLHMNRPFQAVIADNQFVRLRAAPAYANHNLRKLVAAHPAACLYSPRVRGEEQRPLWEPEYQVTYSFTTSCQANPWTFRGT